MWALVAHLREAVHEVVDLGRVFPTPATITPTSSSRSLGMWPPGRSSAEWLSVVAAWTLTFLSMQRVCCYFDPRRYDLNEDSPDKLSEVDTVKTKYGAKTM
jgi:hypothetical protein